MPRNTQTGSYDLKENEKEIIVEIGHRWLHSPDDDVLGEAAILFRLAVAIVGNRALKSGKQ